MTNNFLKVNVTQKFKANPCMRIALATLILWSVPAHAMRLIDVNGRHISAFAHREAKANPRAVNLVYHKGPVLHTPKVVTVFWGPTWATSPIVATFGNFIAQFGTTPEYKTITEYYDSVAFITPTNLGTTPLIDSTTPPTNVTTAIAEAQILAYVASVGFDDNTIYEVVLPPTSYASIGGSTSCGGPALQFCAYHYNVVNSAGQNVKYAVLPYPSCGGCQWGGWTAVQNFEHFACHEIREAVTDPIGTGWYDRQGWEADDKCAWSPAPFLDNGYGYQYEWSNASGGCVAVR